MLDLQALLSRCTFPDGPVDLAVSGGADSSAMLILAAQAGLDATAWHVDHGIRDGSHTEAAFVGELARRFGARFEARTVRVEPGPNLEARARQARFEVLPKGVCTGHTADDQAETVLINMLRGAGIDGLAGMSAKNKPVIALRRSETEAICRYFDVEPFEDPSNRDRTILRNRVRHELVPLLDDIARRDVRGVIARQASYMRSEAELLDALARDIDPTDARQLAAAPEPLAMRALRNWLRANLDDELHPPDRASLERAMRVARGEVLACELPGGWRLGRSSQRLTLSRAGAEG